MILPEDCYFITNPLMRTQSETHAWVNDSVFVGKMVSMQLGNAAGKPLYVKYVVYRVEM